MPYAMVVLSPMAMDSSQVRLRASIADGSAAGSDDVPVVKCEDADDTTLHVLVEQSAGS